MRRCAHFAISTVLLLSPTVFHGQTGSSSVVAAQSGSLQIAQKTEAPGLSLSPGTYTVRVADHLNDRIIIQVQKKGGATLATLLAYPASSLSASTGSGPIIFNAGLKSKPTLRGYAFPGGLTVEFVYPKKDAVALAKDNNIRVMAVDPASEGRPKLPQLTQTDMNEVTLWMLTPTPVQPGETGPGIQAARYQAPAPASAPLTQQAEATTPPPLQATQNYAAASQPAYTAPSQPTSAPVQRAHAERTHIRPAVKQLPHTASNAPLLYLSTLLSLGAASILSIRRRIIASKG